MNSDSIKKLYFKDTSFVHLMHHRIYNVLLYASKYDAFVLEEDGRIDEQLFFEYTSLNLRYPPRFTLVNSEAEADRMLNERTFELIISMPSGDSINPFEWAKKVKKSYAEIPIVVLTPFSKSVSQRISKEDLSAVDYVFSWLGNTDLLLAIIKLIEDKMNVDEDTKSVGVPVILFVEDSIRFYSSIVPQLYKYVFKQSRSFMTEALNEHEQMLRMRGRPKILLARNYEEAISIYVKYSEHMLGIITDVSYNIQGMKNKKAGINLSRYIRLHDNKIPIIIESTEEENRNDAQLANATFLNKNSKTFQLELREAISSNLGFGDFVFIHPQTGDEEAKVENLRGLQETIFKISDETLLYHVKRNNISRWLYSRAMFPLAAFLKNISIDNFENGDLKEVRQIIFDAIVNYRRVKNRGVVAVFQRDRFDQYSNFARIGEGSLGGKGRGLAFIDAMIKRNESLDTFENVQITIPKTVVICTEIFAEFMEQNHLYPIALSEKEDTEILAAFLKAQLPKHLIADLHAFISAINSPVAVRSSSLLEDSHYQPFAGIYSTYMVPYNKSSKTHMLVMITEAIKAVYASVFYKESKAYMMATKNVIDEEKMAIVLQETCGKTHGTKFYPSFSGVIRSLNYYPIGAERAEEGIVNVALGLGKYIMDGGVTLRFSPSYPQNLLQTSTIELALKETQTYFNALDLCETCFVPKVEDGFNILKLPLQEAEKDGTLKYIASTYDIHNESISDGIYPGRKIISFANILKHDVMPLADVIKKIMQVAQNEMGRPVEIEFAVNLDYNKNKQHSFYLLQIRPIVDTKEFINENLDAIQSTEAIITSNNALGHGILSDIYDIVYVRPEVFKAANSEQIASAINAVNKQLMDENRNYILIGPGRWGSSDPWLGIPVKWSGICNARLIVESGLSNYRIDPSQGTHFFQNLTSLGVAYYTINPFRNDGTYDVEFLNSKPAQFENEYIRHVRFHNALIVKTDGRKNLGVVLKP
ncbi:MAG: PEP/pyruvate-binding domain-containing protein [Paludibacter sp.]